MNFTLYRIAYALQLFRGRLTSCEPSMNMRDHHDIPFALPMILAIMMGFIAGALILHFVGNEDEEPEK